MAVTPFDSVELGGRRWEVRLHRSVDAGWRACERELSEAGVALPVSHRGDWAQATGGEHWLLSAHGADGVCGAAVGLAVRATRTLPGYRVVRADKVGLAGRDLDAWRAVLAGSRGLAAKESRILRVEVALYSRRDEDRAALSERLEAEGFHPSREVESYVWTSLVDLGLTEDALLNSFHATARRHIRAVDRWPVDLRVVADPAVAAEMAALVVETRQRTGGPLPRRNLEAMIEVARGNPEALRFVGLFSREDGALLSFACGHREGDLVRYADAASTRRSTLKVPLGYAPLWELMRWAKRHGARHFDLGGITQGTHTDHDPLGGISDFKRYFRGAVTRVGEEWTYTSCPALERWARWVRRAAGWTSVSAAASRPS